MLKDAGLSFREQPYEDFGQRVTNILAMAPEVSQASGCNIVGVHYDTVPSTPGADDNASSVAMLLELARRMSRSKLNAPVLFAAFLMMATPATISQWSQWTFVKLTARMGWRGRSSYCRRKGMPMSGWD
jgi:hypothetical protein